MHIPDAFIPITQSIVYWIIALVFIAFTLRWARTEMTEEKIPLVAIILGSPFAAIFILTMVLVIEGVVFGDGGITTMGANILNMGVIGGFVGYYTFRGMVSLTRNQNVSIFLAAWLACFIPALAAAVEMYFAGTFPLVPGLISMGLYHAAIGMIEGFITVAAVNLIATARPDIISLPQAVSV